MLFFFQRFIDDTGQGRAGERLPKDRAEDGENRKQFSRGSLTDPRRKNDKMLV